jgi:hypothetical protein
VAAKVRTAPARASSYLAQVVVDECAGDAWGRPKGAADYVGWGITVEDLVRHAAFLVPHGETANAYRAPTPREFPKRVKALGVDVKKTSTRSLPSRPLRRRKRLRPEESPGPEVTVAATRSTSDSGRGRASVPVHLSQRSRIAPRRPADPPMPCHSGEA